MNDLKVEVWSSFIEAFFVLEWNGNVYHTSKSISQLLNLKNSEYNKMLIEKVIQHKSYKEGIDGEDVCFAAKGISSETYIERFKKVFAKELVLLALSDILESEGYL